jgi:hypothetical protein
MAFASVVFWLAYIFYCFKSRMRKTVDVPIWHTLLSFFLLATAMVVMPFIIYYQLAGNPLSIQSTQLYGTMVFMGWISSLILGQSFKTLPFIAWVKHYQHLTGKIATPMPADLYNKKLLKWQFVIFSVFLICFYAGLLLGLPILIQSGLICFLLTALVYIANLLLIIFHKPDSKYGTL